MGRAVRFLGLAVIDVLVVVSLRTLFSQGTWFVGGALVLVVVGLNVVVLLDRFIPLRWLAPGLALLVMLTLAPIVYTCYIAFTNYSDDHLLSKQEAVTALQLDTYLAADSPRYSWKAYQSDSGQVSLWLQPANGSGAVARLVTSTGTEIVAAPGSAGIGKLDPSGFPVTVNGKPALTIAQTIRILVAIGREQFGPSTRPIRIASLTLAAEYRQRYTYDSTTGEMTDRQTGVRYRPRDGTFTSASGQTLSPAFRSTVGWANFRELFQTSAIRSVALAIFIWTIVYAIVVVVVQFLFGLAISLALGDPFIPRRLAKFLRSVMLLPYVIPNFLTILVWAALLNPNLGIVTTTAARVFGLNPNWVNDSTGAKVAVILVTFWLGFPYFTLIISGALQSIPEELIEASQVDGAGPITRFRFVVFPLLIRMVGPLVVLGMAFNFNNFLVVYLLNQGNPPFADQTVPAGHTDLLISFTYKLAFSFGNGANYGLAAVITMLIFIILVPVVVSQFRYYSVWQED